MLLTYLLRYLKFIFHVKIQIFVTKSAHYTYPDPHWNKKTEPGFAMKPMRIHNTGQNVDVPGNFGNEWIVGIRITQERTDGQQNLNKKLVLITGLSHEIAWAFCWHKWIQHAKKWGIITKYCPVNFTDVQRGTRIRAVYSVSARTVPTIGMCRIRIRIFPRLCSFESTIGNAFRARTSNKSKKRKMKKII